MKKDITPKNTKFQRHGLWLIYDYNDKLWTKGQYINDIQYGYWINYHHITKITPKITFQLK